MAEEQVTPSPEKSEKTETPPRLAEAIGNFMADQAKQAEEEKQAVIQGAAGKAEHIIKEAEDKAAKLKDNSHKAITQAVRDATLSLKEEIRHLFDGILKEFFFFSPFFFL